MAARVGTGVTGTADAAANSISASAKSTTTGNLITVSVKWEVSGVTLSSVTDTALNTYTIDQQVAHGTGGEPHAAIAYCANATGNASNVVKANFSAATATFRRIFVDEWSGIATSSPVDGTHTSNTGTTSPYSTGAINTTTTGLAWCHLSDFNGLTGITAGGTPSFTLANTLSDCFAQFLISGSAQSITGGGSVSSGATRWVMMDTAFKDAAAGGTVQPMLMLLGVGS